MLEEAQPGVRRGLEGPGVPGVRGRTYWARDWALAIPI